jgi:hypothetical protein
MRKQRCRTGSYLPRSAWSEKHPIFRVGDAEWDDGKLTCENNQRRKEGYNDRDRRLPGRLKTNLTTAHPSVRLLLQSAG